MKWSLETDPIDDLDCEGCDKPIPAGAAFLGTEYGHVACDEDCALVVAAMHRGTPPLVMVPR